MSKKVMPKTPSTLKKDSTPGAGGGPPSCGTCNEPFVDGRFTLPPAHAGEEASQVKMCIPCYQKEYGRMCVACNQNVEFGEPSLNINGRHHHTHCCFCVDCKIDLSTGEEQVALADDGSLLCVPCDSRQRGAICRVCDAILVGSFVNALGSKYHAECFRCCACDVGLGSGTVPCTQGRDKLPYCVPCHKLKLAREKAEAAEAKRLLDEAEAESRRIEAAERAEAARIQAANEAREAAEHERARLAHEHAMEAKRRAEEAALHASNKREADRLAAEYVACGFYLPLHFKRSLLTILTCPLIY